MEIGKEKVETKVGEVHCTWSCSPSLFTLDFALFLQIFGLISVILSACVCMSLFVCVCKRIVRHFRTRTTIDETAVVSTHAKEVSAAADVAVKAR